MTTLYSSHTHTHTSVHITYSLPLLSGGFHPQMFPFLWVPELSLYLSYQLLIATAHND
jgi:hypothetical protein